MAGAGITIIVNDEPAATAINRVIAAGKDLQPLFDDIGASMVISTQHRFETESDPAGKKWAPLAKSTLRRKKGDARILRFRNRLYGSITHNATPSYLEWGTNVVYAAVHQFGATIEHFARSQSATFRVAKEGAFTKADGTRVGSRWRFASKRSKAKNIVRKHITIGEHTITIPARPYLGLDDADSKMIVEKAEAYLGGAAGAMA